MTKRVICGHHFSVLVEEVIDRAAQSPVPRARPACGARDPLNWILPTGDAPGARPARRAVLLRPAGPDDDGRRVRPTTAAAAAAADL